MMDSKWKRVYEKASGLIHRGQADKAIHILNQAVRETGYIPELVQLLASQYFVSSRYSDVIALCERFPQSLEIEAIAHFQIVAWARLGQVQKAEAFVHSRREKEPASEIWSAFLLRQKGDIENAIRVMESLVSRNPDYVDYYIYLADLEYVRGQFERAIEWLENAAQIEPKRGFIYLAKGVALLGLNRLEDAISQFAHGLKLCPAPSPSGYPTPEKETFYCYALAYYLTQNYQKANEYLDKVLSLDPNHLDALVTLAGCYVSTNQLRNAQQTIDRITRLVGEANIDSQTMVLQAYVFQQEGRIQEAEELLRKAADQDSTVLMTIQQSSLSDLV